MSVRDTHIIEDVQQCIFKMLDGLTSSPWDDWNVVLGYPDDTVFSQFSQPFIYVMEPLMVDRVRHQGASGVNRKFSMTVGAWDHRKVGGPEEINLIMSRLLKLFDDPKVVCVDSTFDITLGTTDYSDTNLSTMGVYIDDVSGPNDLFVHDEKEFRAEVSLEVVA